MAVGLGVFDITVRLGRLVPVFLCGRPALATADVLVCVAMWMYNIGNF